MLKGLPITKAGSKHARRVLIEGAWAYRYPARVAKDLASRHPGLSKEALDIAWKAQVRLCQRFRTMRARGKQHNVAVVAIAREMACFLWAIAQKIPLQTQAVLAS
jgi:hypothetical protein